MALQRREKSSLSRYQLKKKPRREKNKEEDRRDRDMHLLIEEEVNDGVFKERKQGRLTFAE